MNKNPAKTILVVDDEEDITAFLKVLLEDSGYRVLCAENGKIGFDQAKLQRPDLVLLDISMPEESGVLMYRKLRGDAETSAIPVIMITGVSHDFKRFIESRRHLAPPDGYFDKPPDRDQLLAKIEELFRAKPAGA